MNNKKYIIELLRSTKREGIDALIAYMEVSGFFTAPCSGAYHLCKDGGLAEHSINVYKQSIKVASSVLTSDEFWKSYNSLAIVAILHDLGKMGDFGKSNYIANILKSGKVSESKPYETNKDLLYLDHAIRSAIIAERFITLTEEEEHAIIYHNGKYTHIGYDLKETKLQMILHFADLWASRVVEV